MSTDHAAEIAITEIRSYIETGQLGFDDWFATAGGLALFRGQSDRAKSVSAARTVLKVSRSCLPG
jgi:hypothetical protein